MDYASFNHKMKLMSKELSNTDVQKKVYQLTEEVLELKRQKKASTKDFAEQIKEREDEIKHLINDKRSEYSATISDSEE